MPAILTLEQVKQLTHAFDNFVTIEKSTAPDYYKQIIPHHCECGGEIIMTKDSEGQPGFTQLQCCNPDCWIKMAHRFAYFAKTMGFKGFGPTSALSIYKRFHGQFKYPTFLSVFELTTAEIDSVCGAAFASQFDEMKHVLHDGAFQFKDVIVALGLPDIGKNSTIFDVVKSPVLLIDLILKGRIIELCEAAGIYAEQTRYYLEIYKLDIITVMHDIVPHVMSTPKREINVAITGHVAVDGIPLTRMEFIWKCESLKDAKGEQAFKLVETKAASKLDYVIADTPSSSSKYRLGKELGKLVTAQQFYDILQSELEGSK